MNLYPEDTSGIFSVLPKCYSLINTKILPYLYENNKIFQMLVFSIIYLNSTIFLIKKINSMY